MEAKLARKDSVLMSFAVKLDIHIESSSRICKSDVVAAKALSSD